MSVLRLELDEELPHPVANSIATNPAAINQAVLIGRPAVCPLIAGAPFVFAP